MKKSIGTSRVDNIEKEEVVRKHKDLMASLPQTQIMTSRHIEASTAVKIVLTETRDGGANLEAQRRDENILKSLGLRILRLLRLIMLRTTYRHFRTAYGWVCGFTDHFTDRNR